MNSQVTGGLRGLREKFGIGKPSIFNYILMEGQRGPQGAMGAMEANGGLSRA